MSAFGCLYVNFMHSQTSLVPDYLEGNHGKYFNAFANKFLVNVNRIIGITIGYRFIMAV